MKQPTLGNIISALADEPATIAQRLLTLGLDQSEFEGKFAPDVLNLSVYGSSFLKFLQDNADKLQVDGNIPQEALPEDYKNGFAEEGMPVFDRLVGLGLSDEEAKGLFSADVLATTLSGKEFQDLLVANQDKLMGKLEELAQKEEQNG